MTQPQTTYDPDSDSLLLRLAYGDEWLQFDLNDYVQVETDPQLQTCYALTLNDYSLLIAQTKYGQRFFPLDGLQTLHQEQQERLLALLLSQGLQPFLSVAAFTPSLVDTVPMITIHDSISFDQAEWQSRFGQYR
ncbi:MAG: hypothetical protein LCH85_22890 [Chloroflexi bacterium]|nr:hypothetical protein [Chloroflexota bacterium]